MDTIEVKLTRRVGDVTATKEFSISTEYVRDGSIHAETYSMFQRKLRKIAEVEMKPLMTRSLPRDLGKEPEQVIAETHDDSIYDCRTFKQAPWGDKCATCGFEKDDHKVSTANSIIKTFVVPSDAPAKRPTTVEECVSQNMRGTMYNRFNACEVCGGTRGEHAVARNPSGAVK